MFLNRSWSIRGVGVNIYAPSITPSRTGTRKKREKKQTSPIDLGNGAPVVLD